MTDSDLTQMGQRHAYVMLWRGGHARQDIVLLDGLDKVMARLQATNEGRIIDQDGEIFDKQAA